MFVSDYRDRGIAEAPIGTFVEHQGNMVKELKNIARDAQDMVSHSTLIVNINHKKPNIIY